MEKNILLIIGLFCFAFSPSKAHENKTSLPQDSNRIIKKKLNLEALEKLKDLDINIDMSALENLRESIDSDFKEFAVLENNLQNLENNFNSNSNINSYNTKQREDREPTRKETKSFSNISEIEIDHKYGNIVVQETNTKQVELEIQYFDTKSEKASCKIEETRGILSITTLSGGGNSNSDNTKIHYIIRIPQGTGLNVDLKYGNIKMDKYKGTFTANLSYSNLDAQSLSDITPSLKCRYGNITIGEVQDVTISASYSNIKINKANKIETIGNYNSYSLNEVKAISTGESSSYGSFKIGTITDMNGKLKYTNIIIDNLLSSISAICSYSDIKIMSVSPKLKNINIDGSYSDISIELIPNISVAFDTSLKYGDIKISKKYNVKYTESNENDKYVTKKGQIGSGSPTANIKVTNKYADIKIK